MNKKAVKGFIVAGTLLCILVVGIMTADIESDYDTPQPKPDTTTDNDDGGAGSIYDDDDNLKTNSLPYMVFEKYGFVLIPLALLMFGAMVGGVVISKEEVEE